MSLEELEKVFIRKGDEILLSWTGDGYWFEDNQYQELMGPVFVDGEKRILAQHYAEPLLEILEEHGLLEAGRQLHISRDEDGAYSVTFLENGDCRTIRE